MASLSNFKKSLLHEVRAFGCSVSPHKISQSDVLKLAAMYKQENSLDVELYTTCERCSYPFVLVVYEKDGKIKWAARKYGPYGRDPGPYV